MSITCTHTDTDLHTHIHTLTGAHTHARTHTHTYGSQTQIYPQTYVYTYVCTKHTIQMCHRSHTHKTLPYANTIISVCMGDYSHQILYNLSINVYPLHLRPTVTLDDHLSDMITIDHFDIKN